MVKRAFKKRLPGEWNLSPSHCYQFDASHSSRCPEPVLGSQVSRRAPEAQHRGTPANKSASLGAQLKCLCANACSMGNKQGELEMCTCLQAYDLNGFMETW